MEKEFNLSEKLIDCSCGCGEKECLVHKTNIKEFIKRLKLELMQKQENIIHTHQIIDKLAGDKLIEEKK